MTEINELSGVGEARANSRLLPARRSLARRIVLAILLGLATAWVILGLTIVIAALVVPLTPLAGAELALARLARRPSLAMRATHIATARIRPRS